MRILGANIACLIVLVSLNSLSLNAGQSYDALRAYDQRKVDKAIIVLINKGELDAVDK